MSTQFLRSSLTVVGLIHTGMSLQPLITLTACGDALAYRVAGQEYGLCGPFKLTGYSEATLCLSIENSLSAAADKFIHIFRGTIRLHSQNDNYIMFISC